MAVREFLVSIRFGRIFLAIFVVAVRFGGETDIGSTANSSRVFFVVFDVGGAVFFVVVGCGAVVVIGGAVVPNVSANVVVVVVLSFLKNRDVSPSGE